ncbi:MAG: RNA methyltransferase [Caldilineaceae bacterium]|nr:RNA methyltransferase [Caldilineaceae bacterium]
MVNFQPPFNIPALVKQIRQLRTPAERVRTGTYYIEGVRIVQQALQAGAEVELAVIAPTLFTTPASHEVVRALRVANLPLLELSAAEFRMISFKENRQGIGAVVRAQRTVLAQLQLAPDAIWVALDGVGNPGNLGAIMRTCDAIRCAGLLLLGDTADPYHPEAVRASMGAFFALPLVRTTFADMTAWARQQELPIIGTSPEAPLDYRTFRYPSPVILLMGSERTGLGLEQQQLCTALTRIPMAGKSDSLNLAVATSVILYEIFHQQQPV